MQAKALRHPHDAPPNCDGRREDRRRAILDAAETLFIEQGFAKVSLAAIIRRSGGSLATVYELFGNKHGLLRAVVERDKYEGREALENEMAQIESAAEILRMIADRVLLRMTESRAIAILRIVISESMTDPEFARDFYREVHLQRVAEVAGLFREWNEDGRAQIDEPEAAAELYIAMVMGDAELKAMLGDRNDLDLGALKKRLNWRIDIFIQHFKIT